MKDNISVLTQINFRKWVQLKRSWIVDTVFHKYVTQHAKSTAEYTSRNQSKIYTWLIIVRKGSKKETSYVSKCDSSLCTLASAHTLKLSPVDTPNVYHATSNEIFVSQDDFPVFVGIPIYLISCSFKMYL
jgi:hypothetical protein